MKEQILTALQSYLDVDIAADVWDESPSLVMILRGADGVITFAPVPLSENIWSQAPVHFVVTIAGKAALNLHKVDGWVPFDPGEQLLGVALFSEGWGASTPDIEKFVEAGGRIVDHPDRVETKMVSAVLVDGERIMINHQRDGETIVSTERAEISGRVPDALVELLTDFQELEKAPRG